MANRRPQNNGRRMDYGRHDRGKTFGRPGVSPWQGGGPGAGIPNLLPLGGGSTEATLALANNLINNLLQTRQQTVPSLLDMPIRRDFVTDMGRFDHGGYNGPNRMGNQGNFRRSGNYNRPGDRMNNRKPFKPGDGQRNQNKTTAKKEADSKAKPVKESAPEVKEEGSAPDKAENGQDNKESPKTRYDDLNPQLLKCHICNKSMWDGRSFENHLSGRAHAIMMQKTAESYALTADTMRQEFKIREMKRTRKSGHAIPRDFYCAMCDMYAGDGAVHRTTVGHRKLKKYLHPACTSCHKEMPTRIELDEHRLTPEHLKNVHDKQEITSKPKPEVMVISTLSMEQSYVRDDRQRRQKDKEDKDDSIKKEPADAETEGDAEQNETAPKAGEDAEMTAEANEEETKILDYSEEDDLSHVTADMIPSYNTSRGVGRSFLSPFSCVQCNLCRKLLDSQETAEVHLKTWRHHQLFVRALREKSGNQLGDSNKRANTDSDPSGDAKRRKITLDHQDDNGGHDVDMKDGAGADGEEAEAEGGEAEAEADGDEPEAEAEGEEGDVEANDGDVELAANGDWANQDDDKLENEAQGENGDEQDDPEDEQIEEVPVEEPVKEKTPPPPPEIKPKATPRGRGRGRRRF